MPDSLLAQTDQQERLSVLYASAVATAAGYTAIEPTMDRDGVDLEIQAGGGMRPRLDIQLKATINLNASDNGICRFPLKVRNYNLLRLETLVPRILVVYSMPREATEWAAIDSESLILKRCAYWVNLQGQPDSENSETVTIDLPSCNIFDVASVRDMMQRVRTGGRP